MTGGKSDLFSTDGSSLSLSLCISVSLFLYLSVSLSLSVLVHTHVCIHVCAQVCMNTEARAEQLVPSSIIFHLIPLRQGLSLSLGPLGCFGLFSSMRLATSKP